MSEPNPETPAPPVTATETTAQPETPAEPAQPDPPKVTETVDYWKARSRENEAKAKANAAAAQRLKEFEDRDLSELQKAQRDAEEARREAQVAIEQRTQFETTALRQRIALEKGLPASLVARLQGATADEVAADADALLALIQAPGTPRPDPSQGTHPLSDQAKADAEYEQFFPSSARK